MSWQKLRKEIQSITPDEFESLIAELLRLFLKQPFVVAGKGAQPSGDARSLDGNVSMQAKRYTGKNSPNAKSVEGDIRQVIRTLPYIQVYVLALSCDKGQLHDTLDPIAEETGLDIVILELTDEISDIGALCVEIWKDICHYFDRLNSDQEFLVWVEERKKDSETKKKLEEVKRKLDSGIQTQYHVKNDVEKYLSGHFSRIEGYNPINLSQAIERQETESLINDWWNRDDDPICFLQGEEGTGKTWLAAKWMKSIHESENIVTFWLDSIDWNGCKSIFDLLKNCLSAVYVSNKQERIPKLQNKAAKIWRNTLIVLDGVNESNAIEASQVILSEYFRIEGEWKDRIRFLFTTRPLDDYPNFNSSLWKKCFKISIPPFNDPELQDALAKKGMQLNDLPQSIKEIAKIPRYFQRCIELKDELGSFEVVTKEMILLADLQYKIEHSDLQIRERLGWTSVEDIRDFLSHLAQQIEWDKIDNAPKVDAKFLKECFTDYAKARIDLKEQGITKRSGHFHAILSSDHVLLCWALYLSVHFDSMDFVELVDYAKGFQEALEPIPSEDLRTEALFVALQISALSTEPDITPDQLSQKRAALMSTWFNSHNAQITKERIDFWVARDTNAYAQVVEFEFKKDILPNKEEVLIEPLAIAWGNRKGQLNHLESYLTNWLLPTYYDEKIKIDANFDSDSYLLPNLHFSQNRLAAAALSILSQRPEFQSLPTLAQCYAIHVNIFQYNWICQYIGKLMRWGFTQDALDDLCSLVKTPQTDEALITGLYGLADELKLTNLPKPLERPLSLEDKDRKESVEKWKKSFRPIIHRIKDQEQLLKHDSPDTNVNGNYHGLDYLAVRTDLPELRDNDSVKINELLQYISANTEWGKSAVATLEDNCVKNLIPWFAKNDPQNYLEFACNFTINFMSFDYPTFMSRYLEGIIFCKNESKRISAAILEMKECLTQNIDHSLERARMFTEILLFNASNENLIDWFEFLATHAPLRLTICYQKISSLLWELLPDSILELAKDKLNKLRSSMLDNHLFSDNGQRELSEFEYWSTLYAYGAQENEQVVTWAFAELRLRKPDSIATYPLLRITLSDLRRFLDAILTHEEIRKHLFCKESVRLMIPIYEGKDVPAYEELGSLLPLEIVGSFLCQPDQQKDFSRWGNELMDRMFSILQGNKTYLNSVEEIRFAVNPKVLQMWADQNKADFLHKSDKYLKKLLKSPQYRQILGDYTNLILRLLLRFRPKKALRFYLLWDRDSFRYIINTYYKVPTFIAELWKIESCNTPKHSKIRRKLLEECSNDEEIMFMTLAALAEGGKEELWHLVTQVYLESNYAKIRNLGVSILPWFGNDDAIEIIENLKINEASLWVQEHAAWAYEVAQQERSCREVYKEALQSRDLSRISAVFEQMKPALTPTAKWWRCQIEEEEGFYEKSQDINPKLIALVMRFWYRWGESSNSRRDITVFDRKLREYCRGEKLGSGSPPRLAPWWKPE